MLPDQNLLLCLIFLIASCSLLSSATAKQDNQGLCNFAEMLIFYNNLRSIVWLSYSGENENDCNGNSCQVNVTTVRESIPTSLLLSSSYRKAAEIAHDLLWFDYPRVGCLTQVTKMSICWFDIELIQDTQWFDLVCPFLNELQLFEKRKQIIESKVIHNA